MENNAPHQTIGTRGTAPRHTADFTHRHYPNQAGSGGYDGHSEVNTVVLDQHKQPPPADEGYADGGGGHSPVDNVAAPDQDKKLPSGDSHDGFADSSPSVIAAGSGSAADAGTTADGVATESSTATLEPTTPPAAAPEVPKKKKKGWQGVSTPRQLAAHKAYYNKRWWETFERLRAFHETHGHCDLKSVKHHLVDPKLANWIASQRESYSTFIKGGKTEINKERINALRRLNFQFNPAEERWKEMYYKLCKYRVEHGDCNPTQSVDAELGKWVQKQRSERKQFDEGTAKKPANEKRKADFDARMKERFRVLDRIGFQWEMQKDAAFDEKLRMLKEFKKEHGHFNFPGGSKSRKEKPHPLKRFAEKQREAFRKILKGEQTSMTKERLATLVEAGFDFFPGRDTPLLRNFGVQTEAPLTRVVETQTDPGPTQASVTAQTDPEPLEADEPGGAKEKTRKAAASSGQKGKASAKKLGASFAGPSPASGSAAAIGAQTEAAVTVLPASRKRARMRGGVVGGAAAAAGSAPASKAETTAVKADIGGGKKMTSRASASKRELDKTGADITSPNSSKKRKSSSPTKKSGTITNPGKKRKASPPKGGQSPRGRSKQDSTSGSNLNSFSAEKDVPGGKKTESSTPDQGRLLASPSLGIGPQAGGGSLGMQGGGDRIGGGGKVAAAASALLNIFDGQKRLRSGREH